jgi:tetratricopeptide (TPR) repeat protein
MRRQLLFALFLAFAPLPATAQIPDKFENLHVLPKDMTQQQLTQRMREFSLALNVRCQHCHAGGDGISFKGVLFASDEKPAKVKAREMLRMVARINEGLATLPARATPPASVDCVTCHRGLAIPKTLGTTIFEITTEKGVQAAVERYRELRTTDLSSGRYNFGEWEINEVGRRLAEAGKPDAAIAIFEMNAEFHPKSAAIDMSLGELYLKSGARDKALARFRAALEKEPNNAMIRRRVQELEAKP